MGSYRIFRTNKKYINANLIKIKIQFTNSTIIILYRPSLSINTIHQTLYYQGTPESPLCVLSTAYYCLHEILLMFPV